MFTVRNAVAGGSGKLNLIKSLAPVFWIKDFTIVSGGYFIDSSGNNKQIQAATTTITNDSLIMPANDTDIISAMTSAGCYSQFYTDDSNPKTVLLSNISPCYNDYGYYGYIEQKNYFLCSSVQTDNRDDILNYINLEILAVQSVQGATPTNVTGIYQCDVGKLAYIDYGNWGNQSIQKVNATLTDHTIASTGYQANTTYQIQLFSQKGDNGFRKLYWNNTNISGSITLKQLPTRLTFLNFISLPGLTVIGTIADLPTGLTSLYWNTLPNLTVIGTIADLPIGLTYLYWTNLSGLTVTGAIADLPIGLTYLNWNNLSGLTVIGTIADLPTGLTSLYWYTLSNLTVTGTIADLPTGLTYLYWYGLSNLTVTGTLIDLPTGLTYLYWYGLSNLTVTGTIDQYPIAINNTLYNSNINNSNIGYTGGTIPAWGSVAITFQNAWTETELRDFFINWAVTAGSGIKTINFAGNNAAIHVNVVDDPDLYDAIQTLQAKGKTLIYNNY